MKRFGKIFSGIAAIMLGVGIILIAFGIGSAREDWETIMGACQGEDRVFKEFSGVKSIEVDLPFGYVDVGVSEDDRVHFTALNVEEDSLVVKCEGGELEIETDMKKDKLFKFSALPFMIKSSKDYEKESGVWEYELLLPKDYNGELLISLGSGRIKVCGVNADEMELFVDAGELVVFEATADRLKAGCDIGNCSVEGLFKEIEVKSDIGMVDVWLYTSKEYYSGVIGCEIGSLEYREMGEFKGWDTKSGIDLKKKWESRNAEGKLKIKCDIGEVNVVFCPSDASITQRQTDVEFSVPLTDEPIPESQENISGILQDIPGEGTGYGVPDIKEDIPDGYEY